MLQTINPQLIAISKESMSYVGSSAAGNKQSNITNSYIMSGERLAILVGKQEGRAGITTIVNMGSFFLFDGDSKAPELISYEPSLAQKTQDDNVKGFSCYHWRNYETLTDADKEL